MSGTHSTHSVFAFVQARSGSTRLPRKVLKTLPEKSNLTILDHIYLRLKQVLPEDRIVFLIPDNDTELKKFLTQRQFLFFEGSENDVRERYILASEKFGAKEIIRLTGDNPFLDVSYLELLCEALNDSLADIASFSNIPIGMGGEIFTNHALCESPSVNLQDRHREHVSLHIKEDSQKFQFIKLQSYLSAEEILISKKIRLTIDEDKDFELAEKVYLELCKDNFFFGVKEVISLYKEKPEIFTINDSVEQISFSVNISSKNSKQKIQIIYAPLNTHGTGHFERSKILHVKLSALGYNVSLSSKFQINENFDLAIIDYRDVILPENFYSKKILLIDNFGPDRDQFYHFDVLPHPKINFQNSLQNILYPSIIDYYKVQNTETKTILTYAGGRNRDESIRLDKFLFETFGSEFRYIRVGGELNSPFPVEVIFRLSRNEYVNLLSACSCFCTYFGQSLMESVYLEKKTLIYSISDYHTELGEFFSLNSNSIFLGPLNKLRKISVDQIHKSNLIIQNSGYKNLIKKIQDILN
ncbi:MAG: spore coat biosynthesis protein F [Leptospiraceae bacterium]|nr:spore coat biosynthesis protein F [Leptospiraceae bacterium]